MNDDETLLLLHGALATKKQFDGFIPHLKNSADVHRITFDGHGKNGPADQPFSMGYFADQVNNYVDEQNLRDIHLFGYSMGGYVALNLAKKYPKKINKVTTLGTILQWNEQIADRECKLLNPQKMSQKIPQFVEELEKRHPHGWKEVVDSTRTMLRNLGQSPLFSTDDWNQLKCKIQLLIGDRDETAGLEATVNIYKKLPNAQLGVLPDTPHSFERVDKKLLGTIL